MRYHPELNSKSMEIPIIVDIRQLGMLFGKVITEGKNTFNGERVYRLDGEGAYTFKELKNMFLH